MASDVPYADLELWRNRLQTPPAIDLPQISRSVAAVTNTHDDSHETPSHSVATRVEASDHHHHHHHHHPPQMRKLPSISASMTYMHHRSLSYEVPYRAVISESAEQVRVVRAISSPNSMLMTKLLQVSSANFLAGSDTKPRSFSPSPAQNASVSVQLLYTYV